MLDLPKISDLPALFATLRTDLDATVVRLAVLESTVAENTAEIRRIKARVDQLGRRR